MVCGEDSPRPGGLGCQGQAAAALSLLTGGDIQKLGAKLVNEVALAASSYCELGVLRVTPELLLQGVAAARPAGGGTGPPGSRSLLYHLHVGLCAAVAPAGCWVLAVRGCGGWPRGEWGVGKGAAWQAF